VNKFQLDVRFRDLPHHAAKYLRRERMYKSMQHIEDKGCLPALLSPCKCAPNTLYWVWINQYFGDLVIVDLDMPKPPHVRTIWQASAHSNYNATHGTHRYAAP
jgi:hypothetical protein